MATGIEDCYVIRENKRLQCGYTTGSCAAGAAQVAARMVLTGQKAERATIRTPKGIVLSLEILEPQIGEDGRWASCAVKKFAGDDPDVTDGVLVYAKVSLSDVPGVSVDGGVGVGRVTLPGLSQPVGEAAINRVPRQMICEAVEGVCALMDYEGGMAVEISIRAGVEIAARTFNPRLGIVGGISVLGTSGIVVPMSEAALIDSIRLELRQRRAQGMDTVLITPGNYGADYTRQKLDIPDELQVKCSNFLGQTMDEAADLGFSSVVLVGHVGKLIKAAGGIMNTHSHHADARAELMAAFALRAGGSRELAMEVLETVTTEEALKAMKREGVMQPAMQMAADRAKEYLDHRVGGRVQIEVVLFSSVQGFLAETDGAEGLLGKIAGMAQEKRQE